MINWNMSPSIAIAQAKDDDRFDNDLRRIAAIMQAMGKERRLREAEEEEKKRQQERWMNSINNLELLKTYYDSKNPSNFDGVI